MSIEEARAAVLQRLQASDYNDWSKGWDGPLGDLKDEPLLDRLILEVKASMPCYYAWGESFPGDPPDNDYACSEFEVAEADPLCPSCEAREQLKVPA